MPPGGLFARIAKVVFGLLVITSPHVGAETWRISIGPSYRSIGGFKFNTGSFSSAPLPTLVAPSSESAPYGSATGLQDRSYDNGFVFRDINTGNPAAALPNATAFWGYNDNTQVQGGNLTFNGSGNSTVFSQTISSNAEHSWGDHLPGAASVSLNAAAMAELTESLSIGLSFGFTAPRFKTGNTSSTFRANQLSQSFTHAVTDTYGLQGVVPPLAPFSGSFNPSGPSPVIDNEPTSRTIITTPTGTQTAVISNEIDEELEVNLYTVSFGPTAEFKRGRWSGGGTVGLTLNVIDWNARFSERLYGQTAGANTVISRWADQKSGISFLCGFYMQLQATYDLRQNLSLSVFGRHDWMKSIGGNVGPSSYEAILDGFTLGCAMQFRF